MSWGIFLLGPVLEFLFLNAVPGHELVQLTGGYACDFCGGFNFSACSREKVLEIKPLDLIDALLPCLCQGHGFIQRHALLQRVIHKKLRGEGGGLQP